MKIIAFGHRSRMGKNTCADILASYLHGKIKIVSFADTLKEACFVMFKWDGMKDKIYYEIHPEARNVKLPNIGMTPVEIWIKVGTPLIREGIYNDNWIEATFHQEMNVDYLIITDLRFPNEVEAIRKRNGIIIKVTNTRVSYRDSVADAALSSFENWDHYIENEGTINDLQKRVSELLPCIK